jgi:hypothetical protein
MSWSRTDPIRHLRPQGPRWTRLRHRLFSDGPDGWGRTPACYYCGCPVDGADHGVIAHVISWKIPGRAWMAWHVPNMRPSHGGDFTRSGGKNKRCPVHNLDCNYAATAPDAPRDGDKSLPFTREFLARRGRTLAPVPAPRDHGRIM